MDYRGVSNLEPIIQIDSSEVEKIERGIALQKIYYQPSGYFRTAEKLHTAVKKAGYDFSLTDVRDWLHKQAVWQIHAPPPRYIPRVSFNKISIPNEAHQADILYMPFDKIGKITYMFCLNVVDIASRYKASVPIGGIIPDIDDYDLEGVLTSKAVARAFKKIYKNPKCSLTWPKLLITDNGSEFKGMCEELMKNHGVKIQKAKSKRTMGIVERYNRTLAERLFRLQDASDLLLPLSERSRAWVKNLPFIVEDLNNSVTRLLGITPAEAIKKKRVSAMPSLPPDRLLGFDEPRLSYNDSVRYLLEPGELEGGRKRATDCNWSPQIYHIKETLVQKNRPVLYWLIDGEGNGPKRSFVHEELMVIPHNTELPPRWVLKN